MIDFRYHLVSLVAVFIALAVGIALGAGPLREGISDTLESEVSDLRAERTDLRTQVAQARARAEALDEGLAVTSTRTASSTLTGARVVVVLLPGADRNISAELQRSVDDAGGEVPLTVALQPSWQTRQGQESATDLVADLAGMLQLPPLEEGAGPTLPAVVGAALAGADAPGSTGAWLEALDRLDGEGYVNLSWAQQVGDPLPDQRPVDLVLVVSGGLTLPEEGELDEAGQLALDTRLALVSSVMGLDTGVVVAATGAVDRAQETQGGQDPLVLGVRQDRTLRAEVSTTDDTEQASGLLATVLALGWQLAGESGHYGLGDQADAPMPQPPPVRLVTGGIPEDGADGPQDPEDVDDPVGETRPGVEGEGDPSQDGEGAPSQFGGLPDLPEPPGTGDGAGTPGDGPGHDDNATTGS